MNCTAILNAWAVVLGKSIADPRITRRRSFGNYARTITILWICMWFFIRSWYEGAMYSVVQSQPKSPYDTIEKVLASDCKMLASIALYPTARELVSKKNRWVKILTFLSFSKSFYQIYFPRVRIGETQRNGPFDWIRDVYDNEDNVVLILTEGPATYFNLINIPHRRLSMTKGFWMMNFVFYFRQKSILREVFNRKIEILQQSGLTEFWIKTEMDDRRTKLYLRTAAEKANLQIATMRGASQICGVLYFISFVVFILEVLSRVFSRTKEILDFLTY